MKLIITLLVFVPVFLFASEEASEGSDIVARVINLSIFAGILYYLIADKVKVFFTTRTKEIADKLSSLQAKVEKTKELKRAKNQINDLKRRKDDWKERAKKAEDALKEINSKSIEDKKKQTNSRD